MKKLLINSRNSNSDNNPINGEHEALRQRKELMSLFEALIKLLSTAQ